MTGVAGGIAPNVIPDRVRLRRQLPLRARPLAGGGRGAAARAVRRARRAARSTRNWRRPGRWPTQPAGARLIAAGELTVGAQAGLDARGRVRRSPATARSTSGRASRRRRTGATSRSRSPRSCARYRGRWRRSPRERAPLPGPGRAGARTRSCASPRPARGCARARRRRSSTSAWASRARRRRRSSARRWPRRSTPMLDLPAAPRGCPSCARRSPAGRSGASASTLDPAREVIPTLGSKEAVFLARPGARRRPRGRARRRPIRCTSAARVRRQARCVELPLRAEDGFAARPRRRVPDLGRAWRCCGSTTRTTRPARRAPLELYERAAALAREPRLRARLRRGVLGALLRRRAARVGAAGRATARTSPCSTRCPSARRCPGYRSGFVAGDPELDRRAQALPAERRRRAAGVRPARRGRRVGRRGARRATCASSTAPSATCCCRRSRRAGCATRAATPRSSCGSSRRRTPTRYAAELLSRAWSSRPARSSARPARATCGSRSCRRWRGARSGRRELISRSRAARR